MKIPEQSECPISKKIQKIKNLPAIFKMKFCKYPNKVSVFLNSQRICKYPNKVSVFLKSTDFVNIRTTASVFFGRLNSYDYF
ncbi:MAG: hypothetical protein COV98_01575 [Candidatus Altarchaeum sp. CG12_big_fil_rev_8_21_14_0_65_33_22]|nr:MAG: hypothetical protein COV98_01575 [Candidatus Altarchaeum sp. CG12_big_fil_rev_8_21_14_0_65_33_22]PIV28331.1 MAG: hypothetical protein COS36_02525 [Candidatus Altarchaeum sp. CG03_land_8_20_14_0_80_32_618]PIX48739.1 MAG: hypothetical protein COZ53_03095 [Candidatus Altarchaeum sp. CG_4_8_14_3_um_filter_33_2054]PIZ32628.1 MAG: hypothetical protein COY41_00835 [Candidatus Altarchaeum sp. CG_4_10_14_0_8_um_filter_32_851]